MKKHSPFLLTAALLLNFSTSVVDAQHTVGDKGSADSAGRVESAGLDAVRLKASLLIDKAAKQKAAGQPKAAIASLQEATKDLEGILENAPDEDQSKKKLTQALLQLAEIQGFEDSNNEYRETFLKLDKITQDALNESPKSVEILQSRAQLLATWALCENHHLQNADAITRNEQAVETYSELLNVAPSNANTYRGKGNCLRRLAVLSNSNQDARLAMLNQAMECFDRALKLAPSDANIYSAIGETLIAEGTVKQSTSVGDTRNCYEAAVLNFKKSLKLHYSQPVEKRLQFVNFLLGGSRPPVTQRELDSMKTRLENNSPQTSPR